MAEWSRHAVQMCLIGVPLAGDGRELPTRGRLVRQFL